MERGFRGRVLERDLTGQMFHRLTVLERANNPKSNGRSNRFWLCQCTCGNKRIVRGDGLTGGRIRSCGCLQRERASVPKKRRTDLTGQRFGRLTVLERTPDLPAYPYAAFVCQCDCGIVKTIRSDSLTNNKQPTRSCGCLALERAAATLRERITTHGLSKTGEYQIWHAMMARCHNKNHETYKNYGAKGIFVCDRWRNSVEDFISDMGKRPSKKHSLDRIDNKEPYSPENCRWSTAPNQGRNTSRNKMVTIDDVTLCVVEWCELMGVDKSKPYTMKYWGKRKGIKTVDDAIHHLYREWKEAS